MKSSPKNIFFFTRNYRILFVKKRNQWKRNFVEWTLLCFKMFVQHAIHHQLSVFPFVWFIHRRLVWMTQNVFHRSRLVHETWKIDLLLIRCFDFPRNCLQLHLLNVLEPKSFFIYLYLFLRCGYSALSTMKKSLTQKTVCWRETTVWVPIKVILLWFYSSSLRFFFLFFLPVYLHAIPEYFPSHIDCC